MSKEENLIATYLKEINKIPLLTAEQETKLALKAKAGDKAARNAVVNANLRFVITVAKKYLKSGLEFEDLISEGNIGLLTAVDKFDPTKGYKFISYAVWWIRQSILKAICEKSRAIRLPSNKANEIVQIDQARRAVAGNKTEEQEIVEIAEMLNMDSSHVREMVNLSKEMVSLDAETKAGDGISTVGEFLEDTTSPKPEDNAIENAMKDEIDTVLDTLKPNEAKVLRLRYGLNGYKQMSLKEAGDICNLTKERVRQIEKHAIVRMQHPTRMRRLEAFIA
ncbi:MAG: RNA polymerase sigma factor RpoD/SigA [Treponema sp.]|nr:RNA polymerase sigma factor RpoD/SigA [Treponema sp.]